MLLIGQQLWWRENWRWQLVFDCCEDEPCTEEDWCSWWITDVEEICGKYEPQVLLCFTPFSLDCLSLKSNSHYFLIPIKTWHREHLLVLRHLARQPFYGQEGIWEHLWELSFARIIPENLNYCEIQLGQATCPFVQWFLLFWPHRWNRSADVCYNLK